ncbi:class A beta-lactamase, subclass A2 [Aeromonas hydrophila]
MTQLIRTVFILFLLVISPAFARADALQTEIERLLATKKADVGVAVYGLEDGYSLSVNGKTRYPMQSVFKFHIALTALSLVDKGTLHLDQKIRIDKKDLKPNTWSPIRDKHPQGGVELTLGEILRYTVAESDNNGCDILLRLIGGPEAVNRHIHGLGVGDFSIQFNEDEMHRKWDRQFSNWTTPEAAVALLTDFCKRKFLEQEQFDFLWKVMLETATGGGRITGLLPPGTPVAHKTGTSGVNGKGVMAAVNDIGIVTLPDGRRFAIAVFVSNSKETMAANEKIIAEVAKAVWDHFSGAASR